MSFGKILISNSIYRILNTVITFLITVLLSRLAGVAGYGILSLLIFNVSIFNLISSFGVDAGITFHTAKSGSDKILTIIFASVLFQILALILTEYTLFHFTGSYWLISSNYSYWWLGIIVLICISITEKYAALFNGSHLYTLCNKILLYSNLLMLFAYSILYFTVYSKSFFSILLLFVVLYIIQSFLLVVFYHSLSKIPFQFKFIAKSDIKLFFSYSIITYTINAIQFLAYRVDYWFIDYYNNEKHVGWYSLAVRLVQSYWILPALFASILFPKIVKEENEFQQKILLMLIRIINLLNIVTGIALFFLIPWIIPWVFGVDYSQSILPFQLLLPGVMLFSITTILAAYFSGTNKLKVNFYGTIICFAVIFLLDVLLIPSYGIKGAAIASSIGYSITTIYFVCIYCFQMKIPAKKVFILERGDWNFICSLIKKPFMKNQNKVIYK